MQSPCRPDSVRDLALAKGSLHHHAGTTHCPSTCTQDLLCLGWVPGMGLGELPSLPGFALLLPHYHPVIKLVLN